MKQVYVFGAGASYAAAGSPLGHDLVWRCPIGLFEWEGRKPCERGKPTALAVEEKQKNNSIYLEFFSCVENYFKEFSGLRDKAEKTLENGEGFPIPHKLSKKYYIDEVLRAVIENGDTKCIKIIRKSICSHIVKTSQLDFENNLYRKFIDSKLKDKTTDDVSIISFNFDGLLHENSGRDILFDYHLKFDGIDESFRPIYKNERGKGLTLLKLHGSLDWRIYPNSKRIELVYWRKWGKKGYVENYQEKLEPLIIVPHEKQNDKRIETLWTLAKEKIKKADKITVIGYSIPKYDTKAIKLLRKMNSNVELEVIDKDENKDCRTEIRDKYAEIIKKKYKDLFPDLKKEPKIHLYGFEEYLSKCK